MPTSNEKCCNLIDPADYDGKEFGWEGKPFLKGRIRSFLHIPLNFGGVVRRLTAAAQRADALDTETPWLVDENSPWGADLYVAVTKPISGAQNASIDGRWVGKVFEGPYSHMRTWGTEMAALMEQRGRAGAKILVFYTACPKCAKKFGKNYVVLFGNVA